MNSRRTEQSESVLPKRLGCGKQRVVTFKVFDHQKHRVMLASVRRTSREQLLRQQLIGGSEHSISDQPQAMQPRFETETSRLSHADALRREDAQRDDLSGLPGQAEHNLGVRFREQQIGMLRQPRCWIALEQLGPAPVDLRQVLTVGHFDDMKRQFDRHNRNVLRGESGDFEGRCEQISGH